jgi:malate dehydrogenase (oxaloacetate-decarboxylating)(NADP+)
MSEDLRDAALNYHRYPVAGKLEVVATKNLVNQRDLALAYSPGVAAACEAIGEDAGQAVELTARGNLVAVITNGTAVLGLGAIGPLAAKPVMEGKAVLFKKFAGIDVFDLEVDAASTDELVEIIASLEPTFGGINLEDIKAPECFEIETRLRERLKIPVFHDDQHGTAICVAAAIRNGLRLAKKELSDVKLVCSGAGAAALACLDLLVSMGLRKESIFVADVDGLIYKGRKQLNPYAARYAQATDERELDGVIDDADVFLGLSAPRVLKAEQVGRMAPKPLILALANPEPEILPEQVSEVRDDAIIATGRSDYPNQVNNVLCFPFMFRGALDVGASTINDAMKIACVEAIADLAMAESSDVVANAYGGAKFQFGEQYLIPKPFDQRLMLEVPPRVARAAMESGVATRPITDFREYRRKLRSFVFRSGTLMKPIFDQAMSEPRRVVYAEGESQRALSAAQILVDDGITRPLLIARKEVVEANIRSLGLRIRMHEDFDVLDPRDNPNLERDATDYHEIMGRRGVSPAYANAIVLTRNTALAALLVRRGEADTMICGVQGGYQRHLGYLRNVIGVRDEFMDCSAVTLLILPKGSFFIADTHVTENPDAEHVAETAIMAAHVVQRFGIKPRVALLSHSNFGSTDTASAHKMSEALRLVHERAPELEAEGEMQADAAVSEEIRARIFPGARFSGPANLLVMPSLDAANITYNALKILGDGVPVGPILMGMNHPVHVVTNAVTVRGIVNMSAFAVAHEAEREARQQPV